LISLESSFKNLVNQYNKDEFLTQKLWEEIVTCYSEKHRYYHKLNHLENLIADLKDVKQDIFDWDSVLFAVLYHDIVYLPTNNKNEEHSAEVANQRLAEILFPKNRILKSYSMILATKLHSQTTDSDTNYFTDADLSILGQEWDKYHIYTKQIRLEYSVYLNSDYNNGRRKVLNHFLAMDRIFKTQFFYNKYELQARENITKELETVLV
jgi:predicted metal-dependent HD superfamily phosphohydrolase